MIAQCHDALAEELAAWDIDPPLHHVAAAHAACVAWLASPPVDQCGETCELAVLDCRVGRIPNGEMNAMKDLPAKTLDEFMAIVEHLKAAAEAVQADKTCFTRDAHMHNLRSEPDADTVRAVMTALINRFGLHHGVDIGLYACDLETQTVDPLP